MTQKPVLAGITLIVVGVALFAALAYEPANVVAMFGLTNVASEASVVVVSLAVVAACCIAGVAALRRARRNRLTSAS